MLNTNCLLYSLQKPIRCYGDEQLVVDGFVDIEFGVVFEEFRHSGFGLVAGAPWSVGENIYSKILPDWCYDQILLQLEV
jgi:hypothetical protein